MGSDCDGDEDAKESLEENLEDMTDLGRLEQVGIEAAWRYEALEFTPWLAKNMDLLSEAVGIPLTLDGTEVTVGQRRLDMLAHTVDGSTVLIENQFNTSDEAHLGSLLTYSASLEYIAGSTPKTVIWIAEKFDKANRLAIRWLNEHTNDPFAFLAVAVRVVRIGDSQPAPVFDVIEQPNDWDRRKEDIVWRSGLSEDQRSRLGFWSYYAKRYPDDSVPAGHHRTEARCGVESWDVDIALCLWKGEIAICYRPSGENTDAESPLTRLREREGEMRERLGVDLRTQWETYWFYKVLRVDPYDREKWPELGEWIHQRLREYRRALADDE